MGMSKKDFIELADTIRNSKVPWLDHAINDASDGWIISLAGAARMAAISRKGATNMVTKHTPGPWECINGAVYHRYFDDQTPIRVAAMERNGPNKALPTECDANARLIAAAPEMLEALKACLAVLHLDSDMEEDFADEIKQATAAIAKAEGKEG